MEDSHSKHAIISLFLGPLPNHLAVQTYSQLSSHFTFDSSSTHDPLLLHDVDWYEGESRGKATYVPRAVCLDTKWGCSAGAGGSYGWDAFDEEEVDGVYANNYDGNDEEGEKEEERAEARMRRQGLLAWGSEAQLHRLNRGSESQNAKTSIEHWQVSDEGEAESENEAEAQWDSRDAEQDHAAPLELRKLAVDSDATLHNSRRAGQPVARPKPWSHYATFDYHPRSIVPLSAPSGIGVVTAPSDLYHAADDVAASSLFLDSWELGREVGKNLDRNTPFLDDILRPWLESCDRVQAIQTTTTLNDSFAGISQWAMEEIRDELSKCELLCSAVWHDTSNAFENEDRSAQAQRVSNLTSALSFASLSDSSTLFLPIYSPCPANSAETAFRRRASWNDARTLAARVHPYWDSAFVALRLRSSDQTASTLTSRLNWRSDTPISLLEGIMPLASLASTLSPSSQAIDPIDALLASRGYGPGRGNAPQLTAEQKTSRKLAELRQARVDLSGSIESLAGVSAKKSNPATETRSDKAFASATTARGLATSCSEEEASTFSDAVNKLVGCEEPWSHLTTSTLAYNEVRRSYPALRRLAEPRSASQPKQMQDVRTSHSVLSTLRTSPRAATHLRRSLSTVQEALTGHLPLESWGLDSGRLGSGRETGCVGGKEGLGEVKERLYELLGAYEEEEFENDDLVGTDEERADEKDELDWD